MGQAGSTFCCGSQAAAAVCPSTTTRSFASSPKPPGLAPGLLCDAATCKELKDGLPRGSNASPTTSLQPSSQSDTEWGTPEGSDGSGVPDLEAALARLQAIVSEPFAKHRAASASRPQDAGKGRQNSGRAPSAVWDTAAAKDAQSKVDSRHTEALRQLSAALADRLLAPTGSAAHEAGATSAPGLSSAPKLPPDATAPVSHVLQHSCLLSFAIRELHSCSVTDMTQRADYYGSLLGVLHWLADARETAHLLHLKLDGHSVAGCVQSLVPSAQQFKKMAFSHTATGHKATRAGPPRAAGAVPAATKATAETHEQDEGLRVVELLLRVASATAHAGWEQQESQRKEGMGSPLGTGRSSSEASACRDDGSSTGRKSSSGSSSPASGSSSGSSTGSRSGSSSGSNTSEAAYIDALQSLQVQYLPTFASGHASAAAKDPAASPRARMVRVLREAAGLERLLPLSEASSVFVAVSEERATLWKALVVGPEGTPYAGGCFLFDIFFPWRYPACPPTVTFKTTGGGTVRFNPNLYKSGRVCLSLLGTWTGGRGETWDPAASSVLQVLVSIQALILVEQPWFNEPGRTRQKGTPYATTASHNHNKLLREETVRWAMIDYLKAPPQEFADVIRAHFRLRGGTICRQVEGWVQEAAGVDRPHAQRLEALLAQLRGQLRSLPRA